MQNTCPKYPSPHIPNWKKQPIAQTTSAPNIAIQFNRVQVGRWFPPGIRRHAVKASAPTLALFAAAAGNKRNRAAFQPQVLIEHGCYTMAFNGIRDLESEKQLWSGHCRVSRAWLGVNVTTDKVLHFDLILMDAKEQQVYTIKNFELHTTQLKYRPIANTYIMSFSRKTTVEHVPDVPSIPAFKFKFLKASEMASKLNDVVVLSGELCFNSSGSTVLYPNLDIPEVKAFTTRYRIQLDVESSSVPATFIIFEYEAKRFFGVSGNDLFNRTGQNNEVPPPDLLQIVGETKLFHVKFKLNLYSDSQADFTVLKVLEPTEQRAVSVMALRNLAQLNLHDNDQAVRVRLLRLWHTMRPDGVTLDQIHMLFLDNQLFAPLLHVGRIYFLSNFLVQEYDDTYRVAPATIRIRFHNDTVIEELQNAADIPTYSFRFLAANDLPFAVHNHEYLSDLIGEVETVEQEEVLFEDAAILRRKGVQLRLIDIENVPLAIDYTLEDAIWLSEICSISELNLYKTDFTNQGNLYLTTATVKDVTVSWSSVHLKFMVRLTVATGPHEASIMFMTTKFRWIASRIIEATDKEWTNDFRTLLAALRGNILKFMIEFGDFNGQTNEFDLVLRKLFW
ncbi:unnamed protein product [Linum tenue]|uniref:Uncharacterized protein n=1 Tax=Linum tenue TaxID=586396 RepID=A0AAV0P7N9_9ROSI|nr:unnamed protein product [Linum tenue]